MNTMFIVNNVLTLKERQYLKTLIDREIKDHLCIHETAPLYQSHNNMDKKYKNDKILSKLSKVVTQQATKFYSKKYIILTEWFNVCKEDSTFNFHQHKESELSAVFYLKNCEGNGTIFNINNDVFLQCLNEDNSIFFFHPQMPHTIPVWSGKDRYSIAFDLAEKAKKVDK